MLTRTVALPTGRTYADTYRGRLTPVLTRTVWRHVHDIVDGSPGADTHHGTSNRSHLAVGSGAIKEDGYFGRLAALGMNKVELRSSNSTSCSRRRRTSSSSSGARHEQGGAA